MTIRWVRVRRLPRWPGWPAWVAIAWAAFVIGGVLWAQATGRGLSMCLFKRITGLPCPTCGSTRSVLAALHGRVLESFLWNPLVFLGHLALVAWLTVRFAFARTVRFELTRRQRRLALAALLLALAVNWAYVLHHGN